MAKSLFEELGGKYEGTGRQIRKARGLFDTVLNCTRRRRTGNRHLGATAFRLSKTVP